MTYQITSAVIGLGFAATILWLIRRDLLHSRHAFWWLSMAFMMLVLGIFPRISDVVAKAVGISYPPTLVFTLAIGLILVKLLYSDLEQAQLERKVRRLTQRLALIQAELEEEKKRGEK